MATWIVPKATTAELPTPTQEGDILFNETTNELLISFQDTDSTYKYKNVSTTLDDLISDLGTNAVLISDSTGSIDSLAVPAGTLIGRATGDSAPTARKLHESMITDGSIPLAKLSNIAPGHVLGVPTSSLVNPSDEDIDLIPLEDITGVKITAGATPPADATDNDLWFFQGEQNVSDNDAKSARLYILRGGQWIDAAPPIVSNDPGPQGEQGEKGETGDAGASVLAVTREQPNAETLELRFYNSETIDQSNLISEVEVDLSEIDVQVGEDTIEPRHLNSDNDGTDGQLLSIDADGNFEWINSAASPGDGAITIADAGDINSAQTFTLNQVADQALTLNIKDDSVTAAKLNVTGNGTSGQLLSSDSDGSFTWVDGTAAANDSTITISGDVETQTFTTNQASDSTLTLTISDGAITGSKLADGVITGDKLGDDSVDSDQIADGAIDTVHIADDQVTYPKIDVSGTSGQVLTINSAGTNWEWTDPAEASNIADDAVSYGKIDVAGTAGQVLTINADGDNWEWAASESLVAGNGLEISGNTISITAQHSSETHVYATTTARNAATNVAWQQGDIAIITDDSDAYVYIGTNLDSGAATADADWAELTFTSTTETYAGQTETGNYTVPVRDAGNTTTKFLREDGDWVAPAGTAYTAGTGLSLNSNEFSVTNPFTDAYETKLDGIATGADVTPSWVPDSDPGYLTGIADDSVTYPKIDVTGTAGQILTINSAGTNWEWASPAAGATDVVDSSSTWTVSVGQASNSGSVDSSGNVTLNVTADVTPSWVPDSDPGYLTGIGDDTVTYGKIDVAGTAAGQILTINSAGDNWEWAAPAAASISDNSVTYPKIDVDGTAGQVLTVNADGDDWEWADAASGASIELSGTAPSDPTEGDLWYDTTGDDENVTSQLYVATEVATDTVAWVPATPTPSLPSSPLDEGTYNLEIQSDSSVVWTAASTDLSSSDLSDLSDVATTAPTDGQVLTYDSSTSSWGPEDAGGGGGGTPTYTTDNDYDTNNAHGSLIIPSAGRWQFMITATSSSYATSGRTMTPATNDFDNIIGGFYDWKTTVFTQPSTSDSNLEISVFRESFARWDSVGSQFRIVEGPAARHDFLGQGNGLTTWGSNYSGSGTMTAAQCMFGNATFTAQSSSTTLIYSGSGTGRNILTDNIAANTYNRGLSLTGGSMRGELITDGPVTITFYGNSTGTLLQSTYRPRVFLNQIT